MPRHINNMCKHYRVGNRIIVFIRPVKKKKKLVTIISKKSFYYVKKNIRSYNLQYCKFLLKRGN